jgi:predicted RNA-binding Zn ribbon-like protein
MNNYRAEQGGEATFRYVLRGCSLELAPRCEVFGPFADPILTAAIDLLTSVSRSLVRQCADEGCGWLFLDRSHARKRRWCNMADCGNRNKAREHYRRKARLL